MEVGLGLAEKKGSILKDIIMVLARFLCFVKVECGK